MLKLIDLEFCYVTYLYDSEINTGKIDSSLSFDVIVPRVWRIMKTSHERMRMNKYIVQSQMQCKYNLQAKGK